MRYSILLCILILALVLVGCTPTKQDAIVQSGHFLTLDSMYQLHPILDGESGMMLLFLLVDSTVFDQWTLTRYEQDIEMKWKDSVVHQQPYELLDEHYVLRDSSFVISKDTFKGQSVIMVKDPSGENIPFMIGYPPELMN